MDAHRTHPFPMRATCAIAALVLAKLIVLVTVDDAHGTWVVNGNPATSSTAVVSPPLAVPDGSGGAIVAYEELDVIVKITAQRYNAAGDLLWGPTGVVLQYGPLDAELDDMIADAQHGAIVARTIRGQLVPTISVQWVRADGSVRFPPWGMEFYETYTGRQSDAVLHMRDDGSFIVAFLMEDGFDGPTKVRAQAVDSLGTKLWGNGIGVSTGVGAKTDLAIASDGAGGVVIAWQDFRNGSDWDIYAQRLHPTGAEQWTSGGVPVMTAAMSQINPQLVPIGAQGTMVIWEDRQAGSPDIAAGRLRDLGTMAWTIPVCDEAGVQHTPVASTDGNDGAMIAWEDERDGNRDIYAIRVTGGGSTSGWLNDGEAIANSLIGEWQPTITHDGVDGSVLAWKTIGITGDVIYAFRVSGSSASVWGQSPVCLAVGSREAPVVIGAAGDFIVAWGDGRPEGIYAQRLEGATGVWGVVVPAAITSVTDTPGDNGLAVDVSWLKSSHDDGSGVIQTYEVFRSTNQAGGWTQVGYIVASAQASYSLANLPTTVDNVAHEFRVDAVGGLPLFPRWSSPTTSGISIDDPPNAPLSLSVEKIGSWYYLSWAPPNPCSPVGPCPYVSLYRVYRRESTPPGLLRAHASWALVGETGATQLTDQTVVPGNGQEWAVSAVDGIGEGPLSDVAGVDDTASDVGDAPAARLIVSPNSPNPFTESTELVFSLPDERDVRIDVYDVAGRLVLSRPLGRQPSGWNRVRLSSGSLASGVYFCRVVAGAEVTTRKMVVRR